MFAHAASIPTYVVETGGGHTYGWDKNTSASPCVKNAEGGKGRGGLRDTIVMVIHSQITSSLNPNFVDLQNFDINLHVFSCFFLYKAFP